MAQDKMSKGGVNSISLRIESTPLQKSINFFFRYMSYLFIYFIFFVWRWGKVFQSILCWQKHRKRIHKRNVKIEVNRSDNCGAFYLHDRVIDSVVSPLRDSIQNLPYFLFSPLRMMSAKNFITLHHYLRIRVASCVTFFFFFFLSNCHSTRATCLLNRLRCI